MKKEISIGILLLTGVLVNAGFSITFNDNFSGQHNYITEGTAGTGWDGFVGLAAGETVDALNASIDRPGQLYIKSTNGWWYDDPAQKLGPFLYKVVSGDFTAAVKVTDYQGMPSSWIAHNNCGLMARASINPDVAGTGEDWVSMDYFPTYSCGNFVRHEDNGFRTEVCHNGLQWNLHRYLMIERKGDNFHFKTSADGQSWIEMSCSHLTRSDFNNVPCQVGLMQATYSVNSGYAAFDDFYVSYGQSYKATEPKPADNAKCVRPDIVLSWKAGGCVQDTNGHDLYIGTSETNVTDANRMNHPSVNYRNLSETIFNAQLELGTTYYWRVDEVNGADIWTGDVWSFTVYDSNFIFSDSFETPHNYIPGGTAGTGWDGFTGLGAGETVDALNASINRAGQLYIQSTNGWWYDDPAQKLGPFLYKEAAADFIATVKVTDYQNVIHNNCGLMARASLNPDVAGTGEDWVSMDYFPLYSCGNFARHEDNGLRTELCHNGLQWSLDAYLQLERKSNKFYFRSSPDGIIWHELACSPLVRNDLAGLPLQVGLAQATYSTNSGYAAFDDFALESFMPNPLAINPNPVDLTTDVPSDVTLSWSPGYWTVSHDVYFGTEFDDVNDANNSLPAGESVYKGNQAFANCSYNAGTLEAGKRYYWRIDEVGAQEIWKGNIWSFRIVSNVIDDFELYADNDELKDVWQSSGGVSIVLDANIFHTGSKALQINYCNSISPYCSETSITFANPKNWESSNFKSIAIYFHGKNGNDTEQMYAKIESGDWGNDTAIVRYKADANNLTKEVWQRWDIDLQDFIENNPAIRLKSISKLTIGFGNPENPSAGGCGTVYIDDIQISDVRCLNENEPDVDLNDDCVIDFEDLLVMANRWLCEETVEADVYGDKRVNFNDYALLSEKWRGSLSNWPAIWNGAALEPVPYEDVRITGGFWKSRLDTNRTITIPYAFAQCQNAINNFAKAGGLMTGSHIGNYWDDSELYKVIEAAGYSLRFNPDQSLENFVDGVIDLIEAAQWDDGYLYTYYSIPHQPQLRWTNEQWMHESYCAGHFFEAATAYYQTTGKRKILDIAIRLADHIDSVFGPGKNMNPPGCQNIENGLVRLYEVTGEERYLALDQFLIDQRGNAAGHTLYGEYSQDHKPFIEQDEAVGHAVRACYLYSGASDVAALTLNVPYVNALEKLWNSAVSYKQYITGGIGAMGAFEGFGPNYFLPNDSAYCETCAAISYVIWNYRMHLLHGDAKYMDVLERALYNNVLSGVSLSGNMFFYTNPLATGGHARQSWFGCFCCPTNVTRTIASVSRYIYTKKSDAIYVNLFIESSADVNIGGNNINIIQTANYPWDGDIQIDVEPNVPMEFTIYIRIPGWVQNQPMPSNLYRYLNEGTEQPTIEINSQPVALNIEKGFVGIKRTWQNSDRITVHLPMAINRVISNPNVTANNGRAAVERGPIVYCAEFADNGGSVSNLYLPDSLNLSSSFEPAILNGVEVIRGTNPNVTLIPYCVWANRGSGPMAIWLPRNQ